MQRPCGGTKSWILPLSYANAVCCRCIIYDFGRAGGTLNQLLQAGRNIISDMTWCVFHDSRHTLAIPVLRTDPDQLSPAGCKETSVFCITPAGSHLLCNTDKSTGVPTPVCLNTFSALMSAGPASWQVNLCTPSNLRVVFLIYMRPKLTRILVNDL